MKAVKAKYSWIKETGARIDASFHLSDGRKTKLVIENSPYPKAFISEVTKEIFYGGRARRIYVDDDERGIPFMGSADMLKSDFSGLKRISKKYTPKLESYFLEEGWTLISRSGTIGNTVFVNKDFIGKAASEHIIRVVPDEQKVEPGFLYAFLSSKYGYALLTQGTFGAVIQHIEPDHIASLPIPLFPLEKQQHIHELITRSAELRVQANEFLNKATGYFDAKYKSLLKYQLAFTKKISKLNFSWGGRNNDKAAELITDEIEKEDHFSIASVADRTFAPPLFKHIYLEKDNGYPFFKGGELRRSLRQKKQFLSPRGVTDINEYVVKKGNVLVYKSGPRNGMLGSVFIVDRTIDGSCLSDHVIRVCIEDEKLSHWVFAFLKSKVGLRILHNIATGSAILFITPDRLKKLSIPKPDQANLDRNHEQIEQYVEKFSTAHELEEQAIQAIENEIALWQS